ncbi:hypothetical protein PAL_GLEAN10004887 [Pteropus alecto]|uniref:Uncharacterized protein n=1 Tax=Pteropus alecto TaxID=9402 RepID=L5KVW6_PTEAL|nr:hypothetical protein PAL_GLEAN10004887 [Pteropus alecto]
MPGTRLEASAALGLQDLMATGTTSSRNKLSSSRHVVYLQQLAGESFQKRGCPEHRKAASDPSLLLGTRLTTLGKAKSLATEL